jgi:hypothetical protein
VNQRNRELAMNARIMKFVSRDLGILPKILPQGLRYFSPLYYGSSEPYPEARVRPDHLARTSIWWRCGYRGQTYRGGE